MAVWGPPRHAVVMDQRLSYAVGRPTMEANDARTRTPPPPPAGPTSETVVTLTIAAHPELMRIGETAVLEGMGPFELSRAEPDFHCAGKVWGRGLEDPHISRKPLTLSHRGENDLLLEVGGLRTSVLVDGEPVGGPKILAEAALLRGVVLELADRIALVVRRGPRLRVESDLYGLVGYAPSMTEVRGHIRSLADLDIPVFVRGESGTGKELVARALHEFGPRSGGPWVAINLATLPASLAASELFGSVRGAFTGATGGQQGYFRAANGGTLFLDEIGECSLELQAMLLRALETNEVIPLGQHSPERVDVRVVTATDAALEDRVDQGTFRGPLLHRLGAYEVSMPPLRARPEDVGRLFMHFAVQDLRRIGDEARLERVNLDETTWLPASLIGRLIRYDWPGNVRQLRNLVRQLVVEHRSLPQLSLGSRLARTLGVSDDSESIETPLPIEDTSVPVRKASQVPADEVWAALAEARWELAGAARILGISRPALYELARRLPGFRLTEDLTPEEIRNALDDAQQDPVRAAEVLQISIRGLRRRMKKMGLDSA